MTANATVANPRVSDHAFLDEMYRDSYFPDHLVDKCKAIMLALCVRIESVHPAGLPELYALTNAATEEFNALEEEFWEAGSEIETAARECIGMDFWFVAEAYGFSDADLEELIAERHW